MGHPSMTATDECVREANKGYSGHGAQLSTLIGGVLADSAMGRIDSNPIGGMDWNAVPLHTGKPWFLPMVGTCYRLKDMLP